MSLTRVNYGNTLKVDGTNNHVGFGTATPQAPIDATLAAGGDWVARFQNTTSSTPYGVQVYDAGSSANGYPLLQVTNSAGSGAYFRVDSGTGYVTTPNVPAFYVKANALSSVNASGSTIVPAGTNYWNSSHLEQNGGNNFDINNARFTAPVSGWYTFNFTARIDQFAGSYVYLTLVSSRDGNIGRDLRSIQTTYQTLAVLTTTYLAANDYVYPELNAAGDSSINWDSDSFFSGHLVG